MSPDEQPTGSPLELTTTHLDQEGIEYEIVTHEARFAAADEAEAAGVAPENAAKSILLRDDEGYRLAVVPASERLDVHKVRELLAEGKELRLATEDEIGADFPAFELGAIPPLGEMLPAPEIVDRRLLDHELILCNAGDHEHSLLLDPRAIVSLAGATEADICQD